VPDGGFFKGKMAGHPRSALVNFRVISMKECQPTKLKYQKDTTPIYFFNEPHVVLGSSWQRVGSQPADGMDSDNVDLRKFSGQLFGRYPGASPHPGLNTTPFKTPPGRLRWNLHEKRKVFTLFRIHANAMK
jgi:hypothetical protein